LRKLVWILFVVVAVAGCEKDPVVFGPPAKATLLFPELNALCTTGKVLSNTESQLVFKWEEAANAESYVLVLKDLQTGKAAIHISSGNEIQITLLRSRPYSWYVISRSGKNATEVTSDTWRFYNAGQGSISYAPYPPEVVSPVMEQRITAVNGRISLDWNGADVDNDIVGYDVYLGTGLEPPLLKSSIADSKLEDVAVTPGTTYYWKVVAHDSAGNTADSGVLPFYVN
jgi:hypothetical protein